MRNRNLDLLYAALIVLALLMVLVMGFAPMLKASPTTGDVIIVSLHVPAIAKTTKLSCVPIPPTKEQEYK